MHLVTSSRTASTNKRVLIVSEQSGIDESVHLMLAFHDAQLGNGSSSATAAANNSLPNSIEVSSCTSDQEALHLVERSSAERRAYGLIVVDAGVLQDKNPKALLQRLWHFQRDMPVLIHAASHVTNYEHLSDEFGGSSRVLVMRLRLQPFEMGQLISLIIARKLSDNQTSVRDDNVSSQVFELNRKLEDTSGRLQVEHDLRVRLEEKLSRAQRLETIGRLADGVAHYFNNQLTVLQGHLSIALSERDGSPRLLASLEELQSIAKRAGDITSLLITFNHRESREPVPVHLAGAVDAEVVLIKHVLGSDIALEVSHGHELPTVMVDPACLGQIMLSLAVVASEAMPRGGKLSIHSQRQKLPETLRTAENYAKNFVTLTMADNSEPLDLDAASLLSGQPPMPAAEEGVETGLSLVRSLVRKFGGVIDIKCVVGIGTEYSIFLPVADNDSQVGGEPSNSPNSQADEKATILIVDDEDSVSQVMEYVLASQGHKVLVARDANEAWKIWLNKKSIIKMAIVDVQLPGGASGFDLEKALLDEDPTLPVVFICGYTAASLREKKELIEGENFLPKPFGMNELLNIVGKALSRVVRL